LSKNPNLKYINGSLIRNGLTIYINQNTKFIIPRKKVYLNKNNYNHKDHISFTNFNVGNNAVKFGKHYYTEETLMTLFYNKKNWGIPTNLTNDKIKNFINDIYTYEQNIELFNDPTTRQKVFRKNLTFVKFVKPKTPNTLAKKLNKMKTNNKPKSPNNSNNSNNLNAIRRKSGNSAQSRSTNRNNNNR